MAERSRFWTTNNTGDGPSSGYSTSDWEKIVRHWFNGGDEANGGVLFGVGSLLAVSGASSPLSLAAGAAIVYGKYYENDAALNLAITTPVVGVTGFRVVLRVNWAAQTVRAFAVRNTDGLSAIPALTQSAGTTWEISLATGTIATNGAITLTDTRKFIKYSTKIYADQLDSGVADGSTLEYAAGSLRVKDAGITAAKLAAAIAGNGLSGGAGSALAVNVDGSTIAIASDILGVPNGGIGTNQLANLGVTNGKIANGAVDDTKAGARMPYLYRRQGGDASNWRIHGTTTYTPGNVMMQAGSYNVSFEPGASSFVTISFPVAFSQTPLMFVSHWTAGLADVKYAIDVISASQFQIIYLNQSGSTGYSLTINWLAIGAP